MAKACCVPKCKTGNKSLGSKRSVFKVPKDKSLRKQWEAAIPGITSLKPTQFVCERHFQSDLIKKKFVKYDAEGKLIAEASLAHPRLAIHAVPNIFIPEDESMDSPNVREEMASTLNAIAIIPITRVDQHVLPVAACESPLQIDHPIKEQSPSLDIEWLSDSDGPDDVTVHLEPMEEDLSHHQKIAKLRIINTTCVDDENVSINLPSPWSVTRSITKSGTIFVFCHISTKTDNDVTNVETTKYIVFENWSGRIQYYVHGKLVHVEDHRLPQILHEASSLLVILIAFEKMRVCKGMGFIDAYLVKDEGFQDLSKSWHHNQCTLLTKKIKCDNCKKMKYTIWRRREQRLAKGPSIRRISSVSNPLDRLILNALRKKLASQKRSKNRAKRRVTLLENALQQKQTEIAALSIVSFEKKCSSFNVPEIQKITLREIMKAASANSKGRRYSKDWLMLCMLMNIRGPACYEFLRKNNIIPLPCTRTIRNYYSMIDNECGFDPKFAKLLSKHIATKKPMQRHGVLLLNDINLRKSISVCSKNLTYSGLTDFESDGTKSSDINDQSNHGLSLMFQPIADTYTQPIAVFASKNPVKGEQLAKLVVKSIVCLENCGALVHGLISAGASMNKKMATILGVSGALDSPQSWFNHPLDDSRQVFVCSDVPHLIKNIRNRLYNKGRLRINAKSDYIEWHYYESLYDLDTQRPSHARECPKLTRSHIELNNTEKMRVRLATQVFSNSVANGMKFYAQHNFEEMDGYEETARFSKLLNDMFDALNRKVPNQGVTPTSQDYKILESSLEWLNEWEEAKRRGEITANEYLTQETSEGLRLTLMSTMGLCRYLIDRYQFLYLLTGKVNQDNLEANSTTLFQCFWPRCDEIKETSDLIENHVRQIHLRESENESTEDSVEEFYYEELTLDDMSSLPTMSHRDMARQPHEDPEYQKQLRLDVTPVAMMVNSSVTNNIDILHINDNTNIANVFPFGVSSSSQPQHQQQQQQQQQQHQQHQQQCTPVKRIKHSPRPLQVSQQNVDPLTITTGKMPSSPRKGRNETKRCRKIYGMDHRELWCTQCKWKKACTRFGE